MLPSINKLSECDKGKWGPDKVHGKLQPMIYLIDSSLAIAQFPCCLCCLYHYVTAIRVLYVYTRMLNMLDIIIYMNDGVTFSKKRKF